MFLDFNLLSPFSSSRSRGKENGGPRRAAPQTRLVGNLMTWCQHCVLVKSSTRTWTNLSGTANAQSISWWRVAAANELSQRSTTRPGKGMKKKRLDAEILPWCSSLNTFSPGTQTVTIDIGEDVSNCWTRHADTCMDGRTVLKDATLSSHWSCKAFSNLFVQIWKKNSWDRWMDGWTDHCDTLSHIFWPYPFNTVLKLPTLYRPLFFTARFPSQTLCCSPVSSLVLDQPCLFANWL